MRAPVLIIALLTFATSAAAADRGDLTRGEALVRLHCATCHATGTSGVSPNHAAPPFRDLHTRYQIDDLAEGLAEGLLTGHPAMPEFSFAPKDIKAIIAYLKSIQTHQDAALPQGLGR